MKSICFVCKHNVFRSKVAEAYLKKIDGEKNFKVSSGGLIPGLFKKCKPEVIAQHEVAKELGIEITGESKGLSVESLMNQDLIVIVADDIPIEIFKDFKVVKWDIEDSTKGNKTDIKKKMKQIMYHIDELVSSKMVIE